MALLGARMMIEKLSINGQTGSEAVTRLDRTVYEVFVLAHKPASTDNDNYAAKALKRVGMSRIDTDGSLPMLFVTDGAELRSLLKNTAFAQGQSIVNILARLPDATRIRQRVLAGRQSGVAVSITILPD